jgi:DNA-binding transcriptional LysR family regulator
MRATPRGKLKITAPVSFGSECIAPLMADYLDAYPEVSLELNLNDRMVDLVEEGLTRPSASASWKIPAWWRACCGRMRW